MQFGIASLCLDIRDEATKKDRLYHRAEGEFDHIDKDGGEKLPTCGKGRLGLVFRRRTSLIAACEEAEESSYSTELTLLNSISSSLPSALSIINDGVPSANKTDFTTPDMSSPFSGSSAWIFLPMSDSA